MRTVADQQDDSRARVLAQDRSERRIETGMKLEQALRAQIEVALERTPMLARSSGASGLDGCE
jgi:hypothetical protein